MIKELPCFLPPPPQTNVFMKTSNSGFTYEHSSVFGVVLGPSPINNHTDPQKSASSCVNGTFKQMKDGKMSMRAMEATVKSVREGVANNMRSILGIFNVFLRHSNETRNKTIQWFTKVVDGTEPRVKPTTHLAHNYHQLADMILEGPAGTRRGQQPQPPDQNFNIIMQTAQSLNPRLHGYCTPGFSVNAFWIILDLVKPIKMQTSIDMFVTVREDGPALLGKFCEQDRVVDKEAFEEVKKLPAVQEAIQKPLKFPSQIFWVALHAMHTLLKPAIGDAWLLRGAASILAHNNNPNARMGSGLSFAEFTCNDVMFRHPEFMSLLGSFFSLTMYQILACAYPELSKKGDAESNPNPFREMIVPPAEVTSEFKVIPTIIIEDMIEIIEIYKNLYGSVKECELFTRYMDQEIFLYFTIFILGAGDHIKNPNTRGKAATMLYGLSEIPAYNSIIMQSATCANNIIPACLLVFSAVEQTHQSYYDIRMQIKFELRIPIMKLISKVLESKQGDKHKQTLKDFSKSRTYDFNKFANLIMNDVTYLIDEGMDTLIAVRKRERKVRASGATGDSTNDTDEADGVATAGLGVDRQQEDEDMNEDGQDMYARSRQDPKEHCKRYMEMGHRTAHTLWSIATETPSVLVSDTIIITQMLQSCLNPLLDRLVGPKCLELKGNSKDFETYNFDPKKLLQWTVEMFVCVAREVKDKAAKIVSEDARNFKNSTFSKAVRIAKREKLVSPEMVADFEKFVEAIHAVSQQAEAAADVEIPDEFLDPIMADIMMDPVELPSGNVMDRKNIERIILTDDADPFNRQPLKKEDLKPLDDLRTKIEAFCTENKIAYDQNS
eukprot:gene969-1146_t